MSVNLSKLFSDLSASGRDSARFAQGFSGNASHWMRWLGEFAPDDNPQSRTISGYMADESKDGDFCSVILNSDDLRSLARAATEIADKLDKRAFEESLNVNHRFARLAATEVNESE